MQLYFLNKKHLLGKFLMYTSIDNMIMLTGMGHVLVCYGLHYEGKAHKRHKVEFLYGRLKYFFFK